MQVSKGIYSVIFLLLLVYPLLCSYDVSKSTFSYYDFIAMNPHVIYYLLALVAFIAITVYVDRKLSLFSLLAIVSVFSFVEAIGNYPLIFARDVYLHGSSVKAIAINGHLVKGFNKYPLSHPGFFLLWTIVVLITGLDIKSSNLILSLPVAVSLLALMLILLYRKLGIRKDALCTVALLAWLVMNNQVNELSFFHFNTRLYSLVLILTLLLFMKGKLRKSKEQTIFMAIFFSLTISHIIYSLVPIAFLFFYWLIEDKRDKSSVWIVLLCLVIYLVWNLNMATQLFGEGLHKLLDYYHYSLALETATELTAVTAPYPFYGKILKQYYKVLIVTLALVSLWTMIKLKSKREVRILSYLLLGGGVVFTILSIPDIVDSIDRGLMYFAIPLAPLSLFAIASKTKGSMQRLRLMGLTLLLLLLVVPHFVLVHEATFARGNVEPTDAFCRFLSECRNGQRIAAFGDFRLYFCFFEPSIKKEEFYLTVARSIFDIANLLLESPRPSIRVVDFRNVVDWGYRCSSFEEAHELWIKEIYRPLESHYCKIYDNGFEVAFC